MMAVGMTAAQIVKVLAPLDDPHMVLHGHPPCSTSGRWPDEDTTA
jgi:hypothetical protein